MTKHLPHTATTRGAHGAARTAPSAHAEAAHPRSIPVIAREVDAEQARDQPFAEGAYDAIDPDLRHRMISEAAYRRYAERGYDDGYDRDDWLQAEADVDRLLVDQGMPQPRRGRA